MSKYHFLVTLLILLAACNSEQKIYGEINFPVIDECKDRLFESLDEYKKDGKIIWTLTALSNKEIHGYLPNFEGIVTIKGISEDFENWKIEAHITSPLFLSCYPTVSVPFETDKLGDEFNVWRNAFRRKHEPITEYFYIQDGKIIYQFRDGEIDENL